MDLSEMIFSIVAILVVLGIAFVWWKKTRPRYLLSFLEPGDPTLQSYKPSMKTKNRYFPFSEGVIDLSKHKDLLRFKEVFGDREYLVEPWTRQENLYIEEGKTKALIFEFIKDNTGAPVAIPCLRTIETIIEQENDDPLLGYRETHLGVEWGGKRKIVKSDNLIGIVVYEGV